MVRQTTRSNSNKQNASSVIAPSPHGGNTAGRNGDITSSVFSIPPDQQGTSCPTPSNRQVQPENHQYISPIYNSGANLSSPPNSDLPNLSTAIITRAVHFTPSIPNPELELHSSIKMSILFPQIEEKIKRCPITKVKFLPPSKFRRLITQRAIEDELLSLQEDGVLNAQLVTYVLQDAPQTFCILVRMGYARHIKEFHRHGFRDKDDLPIQANPECTSPQQVLFKKWRPQFECMFREFQWTFLAPTFGKRVFRHILPENSPIPVLSIIDQPKDGIFSVVYKAKLDVIDEELVRLHII